MSAVQKNQQSLNVTLNTADKLINNDMYETKKVSEKPEIFKENRIESELNAKFDGLDID